MSPRSCKWPLRLWNEVLSFTLCHRIHLHNTVLIHHRKDDKGRLQITRMTKDEAEELGKEKLAKVESRNESDSDASDDEARDVKKLPEFTEEEYLLASPVVLGFSFGEKLWLEFTVSGIKEISWNVNAYESLVLEAKTKETVKVGYILSTHNPGKG